MGVKRKPAFLKRSGLGLLESGVLAGHAGDAAGGAAEGGAEAGGAAAGGRGSDGHRPWERAAGGEVVLEVVRGEGVGRVGNPIHSGISYQ
jgi:hypothetical protein